MLNPRYGRLFWRYLWRRGLTAAGRRWTSDGPLFLGRGLELKIEPRGEIRFGRFVWVGDGTKIRCHEGEVEIGAKTVIGQECTISAYKRVRIGEQCVIADRAMFIDFDHGATEVERPIRVQGIYKRNASSDRTSGSATAPASCEASEWATTRSSEPTPWSQRTCRQTPSPEACRQR